MALLQKIKEKLGFGSGASDADGGETTVTVEHESTETDAAESTETDAAESTEGDAGVVETDDSVGADGETSDETDDGDEGVDDAEAVDIDDAETVADAEAEATDADEAEATDADEETEPEDAAATDGTPVDEIKGIGPAYAERLGEIGIYTVEDLAGASAAAVADGTSVGEGRAATWIERATEF